MSRSQIAMLVLVLVLGGFYYVHDIKGKPEREQAETRAKRLFPDLKKDDLTGLTIERFKLAKDAKVGPKTVLEAQGGRWLEKGPPLKLLASQQVGAAISGLVNLQQAVELAATPGPEQPSEFGLDKPAYKLAFTTRDGQTHTLTLGDRTPDEAGYYVQTSGSSAIYSINATFSELLETPVESLRDKSALPVEPSKVNKVRLTRADGTVIEASLKTPRETSDTEEPEGVTITNLSEEWLMVKPAAGMADGQKVRDLLWAWKNLQAGRFLNSDETVEFAHPEMKVEAWVDGRAEPQVVEIGPAVAAKPTMRYARRLDPPETMVVDMGQSKLLASTAKDLEFRHLAEFQPEDVKRVTAQVGKLEVQATRSAEGWTFTKPADARPDAPGVVQAVNDLVWDLKNAEWDAKLPADKAPAQAGSRGQITLYGEKDKVILQVRLGPAEGTGAIVGFGDPVMAARLAQDPAERWEGILKRVTAAPASPGAPQTPMIPTPAGTP